MAVWFEMAGMTIGSGGVIVRILGEEGGGERGIVRKGGEKGCEGRRESKRGEQATVAGKKIAS